MRARYSATVNELESVKKDVLEPAGAVLRLNEERRGDGIIDTVFNCGPDVACPTVGGVWYVPMEKGEDQKTLKSILQQ